MGGARRHVRSAVAIGAGLALTLAACGGDPPPFASEVTAGNPVAIAVADDGTYYFGGHAPFVGIRFVNSKGRVGYFAGHDPESDSPVPKASRWVKGADVGSPLSLVIEPDGAVLILDQAGESVTRITADNDVNVLLSPANSSVSRPHALATDADGNIYITEPLDNRVRVLSPGGDLTVFAGTGIDGSGGDGGLAAEASLSGPTGIAIDASGNVYIGERSGRRIRRVDTSGTISTIAGTGEEGSGGDGGPATSAQFTDILGLAVDDAGNLFVVDSRANRVRRIDASGVITTVAGTGEAGFDGDLGPAAQAKLCFPEGIAVDNQGRIFIADTYNGRIRRIGTGGTIATVAGAANTSVVAACRPS